MDLAGSSHRVVLMRSVFRPLGVVISRYVAYALARGEIYARSGIWGKAFRRDENEFGYCSAVISYGLLASALVFLF
jgi:hypothetical protein